VNEPSRQSPLSGLLRTLLALVVLLAFLGAVGYTFWPQLLPIYLGLVGKTQSIGAETIESKYFEVRNNSRASQPQLKMAIRTLEADYEAIVQFTGQRPENPITVLFTDGEGMAFAEGDQLTVYYNNGIIELGSAPFFLVFLTSGRLFLTEGNLFLYAGYAIYVTEEVGRAEEFIRQSSDNWVTLFRQKDALLPLTEAVQTVEPTDEDTAYDFIRAILEWASFLRWVAQTYDADALIELLDGQSIENVTGFSLDEAQSAWLEALTAQNIQPKPCRMVASYASLIGLICEKLDEAGK